MGTALLLRITHVIVQLETQQTGLTAIEGPLRDDLALDMITYCMVTASTPTGGRSPSTISRTVLEATNSVINSDALPGRRRHQITHNPVARVFEGANDAHLLEGGMHAPTRAALFICVRAQCSMRCRG